MLVWVLRHFEPEYRRLMVDDLLFSNNSNIFVIDDETAQQSNEHKAFYVRCHFRRAYRDGFEIKEQWGEEVVPFASLSLDVEDQRAFSVDFAGDEKRLRAEVENDLRRELFDLFEADWPHNDSRSPLHARWAALKTIFAARGIELPGNYPQSNSDFRALVIAVRSMEFGHPVVWDETSLLSVVHRIFLSYKGNVVAMIEAIRLFDRRKLLIEGDISGKWVKKRGLIKEVLDKLDGAYLPNTDWLPMLKFLYPEICAAVQSYADRYWEINEGRAF